MLLGIVFTTHAMVTDVIEEQGKETKEGLTRIEADIAFLVKSAKKEMQGVEVEVPSLLR